MSYYRVSKKDNKKWLNFLKHHPEKGRLVKVNKIMYKNQLDGDEEVNPPVSTPDEVDEDDVDDDIDEETESAFA